MEIFLYIVVLGIVLFALFLPAIIRYKASSKDYIKKKEQPQSEREPATDNSGTQSAP